MIFYTLASLAPGNSKKFLQPGRSLWPKGRSLVSVLHKLLVMGADIEFYTLIQDALYACAAAVLNNCGDHLAARIDVRGCCRMDAVIWRRAVYWYAAAHGLVPRLFMACCN